MTMPGGNPYHDELGRFTEGPGGGGGAKSVKALAKAGGQPGGDPQAARDAAASSVKKVNKAKMKMPEPSEAARAFAEDHVMHNTRNWESLSPEQQQKKIAKAAIKVQKGIDAGNFGKEAQAKSQASRGGEDSPYSYPPPKGKKRKKNPNSVGGGLDLFPKPKGFTTRSGIPTT